MIVICFCWNGVDVVSFFLCSFVRSFVYSFPSWCQDNTYDAVYSVEATCHAPSKVGVYSEVFRVLKPGGLYGTYEWVITDNYDENDSEHVKIKKGAQPHCPLTLSSVVLVMERIRTLRAFPGQGP